MFQVNDAIAFNFAFSPVLGRVVTVSEDGKLMLVLRENEYPMLCEVDAYRRPIRIGRYVPKEITKGWGLWKKTETHWELEPIQGGTDGSK